MSALAQMEGQKANNSPRPVAVAKPNEEKPRDNAPPYEPEKKIESAEKAALIASLDEKMVADIPPAMIVYQSGPDLNAYQQKKTLAQGMMDLALLSANANQLRFILETKKNHPYFYTSIMFIGASIFFQIAVAFGLILNGKYNIQREHHILKANRVNNFTIIGIFIITVINVFVSAFAAVESSPRGSD